MHKTLASFKRNSQLQIPPGGKYYLVYSDWDNQKLAWGTVIWTKTNDQDKALVSAWRTYKNPLGKTVMGGSFRIFLSWADAMNAEGIQGTTGWMIQKQAEQAREAARNYDRRKDADLVL